MKTMTTIQSAEKTDTGSYVATVLGGEKLGTKDAELGEKLLAIFAKDPDHCMCEIEYEVRGERLYLTGIEYIEAPEELGGPAETVASDAADTESGDEADPPVSDPPSGLSLENLITVSERVSKIEEYLEATTKYERYQP